MLNPKSRDTMIAKCKQTYKKEKTPRRRRRRRAGLKPKMRNAGVHIKDNTSSTRAIFPVRNIEVRIGSADKLPRQASNNNHAMGSRQAMWTKIGNHLLIVLLVVINSPYLNPSLRRVKQLRFHNH